MGTDGPDNVERTGRRNMLALAGAVAATALAGCTNEVRAAEDVATKGEALTGNVYETLADLKADHYPLSSPAACYVLGYYAATDGGGGHFSWDGSSLATPNDGTVILPDTLYVTDPGRWLRLVNDDEAINVQWFGAKADGTDDTTKLQNAIDAAHSAGLPVIFAPGKTYLSDQITLSAGDCLVGYGATLTARTANQQLVYCNGADGVRVEGLTVKAVADDVTGRGVAIASTTRAAVVQCTFTGFGRAGVSASNSHSVRISGNTVDGSGATVSPSTSGIYFDGGGSDFSIIGNDISNVGQGINGGEGWRAVTVAGNTIHEITDTNAQHGMYLHASDLTIVGNTVRQVTSCGIKVHAASNDQAGVTIVGNAVDGGWVPPGQQGANTLGVGTGIVVAGPGNLGKALEGVTISGNAVTNFSGYGINTNVLINAVSVSNNTVRMIGSHGIYLASRSNAPNSCDFAITNNVIRDVAKSGGYGVFVDGTSPAFQTVVISGNLLDKIGSSSDSAIYASNTIDLFVHDNVNQGPAKALETIGCTNAQFWNNWSAVAPSATLDTNAHPLPTNNSWDQQLIYSGAGAPTLVSATGSIYLRTDGGSGSTLYVMESGAWAAK